MWIRESWYILGFPSWYCACLIWTIQHWILDLANMFIAMQLEYYLLGDPHQAKCGDLWWPPQFSAAYLPRQELTSGRGARGRQRWVRTTTSSWSLLNTNYYLYLYYAGDRQVHWLRVRWVPLRPNLPVQQRRGDQDRCSRPLWPQVLCASLENACNSLAQLV